MSRPRRLAPACPKMTTRARLAVALLTALTAAAALAACGGPADGATYPSSTGAPSGSAPGAGASSSPGGGRQAAIANGADPANTDAAGTEWICRPGQGGDPCTSPETAQVLAASGPATTQQARPAPNPPIDCFYIMPTVSTQPGLTANLKISRTETVTTTLESSRFSADCNVYAPVYPQITLRGLKKAGAGTAAGVQQGYQVVQAAWQDYLAHYNHGHGVVIIAHSQGSAMAEELLRTQVDPNPQARQHLVSAIIPGGNVVVPAGKQVGGTFQHIPACATAAQLHCVVAYSSFGQAPPSTAFFGIPGQGVSLLNVTPSPEAGMQVMCVNPAALAPGDGAVEPYLPTDAAMAALKAGKPLSSVPVPWQTTPGLYSVACAHQGNGTWLQVTAPVTPGDTRTVVTPPQGPRAGLHRFDIDLFLGNLTTLVQTETTAYQGAGN